MRVLVWQWGRRGSGPRYGLDLARALDAEPGVTGLLSLSRGAEIMRAEAPDCDLPVDTYGSAAGYAWRLASVPLALPGLVARLRPLAPTVAICAMPGPLDLLMAAALRRLGVPFLVVVHDADAHPGDGLPLQMTLQALLLRRADALVALSAHVADRLQARGVRQPILRSVLPPAIYGPPPPPPGAHGGRLRVLSFGRLRPYKGLGLLAAAWRLMPPDVAELRVVGSGPESAELASLRALPGVTVENRWVPEAEVRDLLAWADVMVLSHTEASQSGGVAAAQAAGRWIVATRVGGMIEQLGGDPRGLLCNPTPDGLAAALLELPSAPLPPAFDPTQALHAMAADLVAQLRLYESEQARASGP